MPIYDGDTKIVSAYITDALGVATEISEMRLGAQPIFPDSVGAGLPTISASISARASTSITIQLNVDNANGAEITEWGYSLDGGARVQVATGVLLDTGATATAPITGLTASTNYSIEIYAINSQGEDTDDVDTSTTAPPATVGMATYTRNVPASIMGGGAETLNWSASVTYTVSGSNTTATFGGVNSTANLNNTPIVETQTGVISGAIGTHTVSWTGTVTTRNTYTNPPFGPTFAILIRIDFGNGTELPVLRNVPGQGQIALT